MNYQEFIAGKQRQPQFLGFDTEDISDALFPFQRDVVKWAVKLGRAAIFQDCGMGKTIQQLDWARIVGEHANAPVLILAPLAVSSQTVREGKKFGIPVHPCRDQNDIQPGINITNYEKLHHFSPDGLAAIVLDESSILKSFSGKVRQKIQSFADQIHYRLACTATPAPNDIMEIGTHSEFLGQMRRVEMLSEYFVHDGGDTQKWRIKGHAEESFWAWMASWCVAMRKPSDLGYDDGAFILPALSMDHQVVESPAPDGYLFPIEAASLNERRLARRASMDNRVEMAAKIACSTDEPVLIWCNLNDESRELAKAIPGAVEVVGSDTPEFKENAVLWFTGNNCICKKPGFRDKLTPWTKKSISENITNETDLKNLNSQKEISRKIEKRENNTCENMPNPTETNSGEPQNNRINTTQGDGKNTQHCPKCGKMPGSLLGNGRPPTLISDSPKDLNHLGLLLSNTEACSCSKVENAQFADQHTAGIGGQTDSSLTIAIKQGKSGGFFVPPVILESENSETTQSCSTEPQCTCGGLNPRAHKVLISKPSMLGYGLNLQNCRTMIFVGLSDSYEQLYQAIRRCWRFGQTRPVTAHIITSDAESAVVSNIERKERQASEMFDALVRHISVYSKTRTRPKPQYKADITMTIPSWLKEAV